MTGQITDAFVQIGRDGGAGKSKYSDFLSAYSGVSDADRRRAFIMLAAAGVTMAVMLLTRLLWLFKPLLDRINYGILTAFLYYLLVGAVCVAYSICLNIFLKKKCGIRLFRVKRRPINTARAIATIAVAATAVFVISASLGFRLKLQHEMGMGVTAAQALSNVSVYLYYAFHLWFGFMAAALVQYAMSMLFPAKYTVPWGGIFLVTVYGLIELLLEVTTTAHLFPFVYYALTYVYAAIFILTGRGIHIGFWASFVVMVL